MPLGWYARSGQGLLPRPARRPHRHSDVTPAVNQVETHVFLQRSDEQMQQIAVLDAGASLFFDHRDPDMVARLTSTRLEI